MANGGRKTTMSGEPRIRESAEREGKEAIRRVEGAGWELDPNARLPPALRHQQRSGLVTIAGKLPDTLHPKTWASIVKQAGLREQDE